MVEQTEIHRKSRSKIVEERKEAAEQLSEYFATLKNKKQAWEDLHQLTQDNNYDVRWGATGALGDTFSAIPEEHKQEAWENLHQLTQDKNDNVRRRAADALGVAFSAIPEEHKQEAWEDLHQLTQDNNYDVRWRAADALGSAFPSIPEKLKHQAWDDLHSLTSDNDDNVRGLAYHSLGKASIFRATFAKNDNKFKKLMEEAIGYFEKSKQHLAWSGPANFCLPFYRSFYTLTFKKEEADAEVQRYIAEAKRAVEDSESKEKLLEAVENLGNALKEVHKARDFNAVKSDLNAYRRYCERACELLETTQEKAPGASRLVRKGLPIIDDRIKGIIAEIQEKAKAACQQSKGTPAEEITCATNRQIQKWRIDNQDDMTWAVDNLIFSLSSKIPPIPKNKHIHDRIENIRKEKDVTKQYIMIANLITLIPSVSVDTLIYDSTIGQVGNGTVNMNLYGNPKKEFERESESKKSRNPKKPAISIDEKIQQNNDSIEKILDNWGFRPSGLSHGTREQKKADIEKWLRCFEPSEFEDAFLIMEKIQYHDSYTVEGYIERLSRELNKLFDRDLSGVLFYPLGDSPSSSGGNLLYSFRKNLRLPESSFPYENFKEIDLSGKKAIVFLDDIIGSGNQAVRFAKKNLQDIKIDKYYVTLMAFEKGYERVTKNGTFKKVIPHKIISEELKAFSPESQVFPDAGTRERIKALCEKYGKLLYPEYPLGFDNSQSLIVFPHNTPNNTLPIIWAGDNNEKEAGIIWYPLWERKKRT